MATISLTVLGPPIATASMAQTTPAAPPPPADLPPPGYWIDGIHLSAQFEAGIIANPSDPKLNNGQSFTDHPNQVQLNQILLGAEKKLDPKATGYDWAFRLSALYGSDARYTHFLGLLDQALPKDQRDQIDVVEASATLHLPVTAFEGGLDIKAGLYPTPLGSEVIDPAGNAFYSHSYIFNYALPYKHTGVLAIAHATALLDLYLGLDTGSNTTFGPNGDDNGSVAGIVGFGLNMMDGDLTVLALSHIGPENPARALDMLVPPADANSYMRYYNDIVMTWKANDKLTLTTEASWVRDDFGTSGFTGKPAAANGFGLAQYAGYALTGTITLNARIELFRDDSGFFVGAFPGNYDPVYVQKGLPNTAYFAPPATYGAITLGATFKPDVPAPITGLAIRPEIRYDQSLSGNDVFNGSINQTTHVVIFKDRGALTIGTDAILTF